MQIIMDDDQSFKIDRGKDRQLKINFRRIHSFKLSVSSKLLSDRIKNTSAAKRTAPYSALDLTHSQNL